jgi:hypothetical protein
MNNFSKVANFQVTTPKDYVYADLFKKFFSEEHFYEDKDFIVCSIYEKQHAIVSNELLPGTSYSIVVYKALKDVSTAGEIEELLKEEGAIKSGSQALLLSVLQRKEDLPIGGHIISPEEIDILPEDDHGYRRHLGLTRYDQTKYGFDHGEASGLREGDYLMITKMA